MNEQRYEDIFGHLVPYVRIKDHVLKRQEIVKLVLTSEGFLPTIDLHVYSPTKSLARENQPVDGDRVSIGIRQDLKIFKPIASDFVITSVDIAPNRDVRDGISATELWIKAKLFIPNLDSELVNFTYTGLAEDALKEACIRVGLGYVHSVNTKTLKKEHWHCFDDPIAFFKDVTAHMWLAKDSFFDSWIDPRRKLNVINVNDMLGRKLSDDGELDFTKYKSLTGTTGADGKYISNDLAKLSDSKWPKLLSNDYMFENSLWYVEEYQYINNSTNISKKYGIQENYEIYVQNHGIGQSENESRFQIDIGVWYNQEKLDRGYVIANGPTNYAKDFKQASNGSWKDMNTKTLAPILMPVESDVDAETKISNQSNLKSSGNFSKEYIVAPKHNLLNNAELEKQIVKVTCKGCNLGIMKGEKVPMVLYNRSNEKYISETRNTQDTAYEFDMYCSGWFLVKGVSLIYEPSFKKNDYFSDWKTEITLTRREWIPPESTSDKHDADEFGTIEVKNDVASGTSVESQAPTTDTQEPTTTTSQSPEPDDTLNVDAWDIDALQNETSAMDNEVNVNKEGQEANATNFKIINAVSNLKESVSKQEAVNNALQSLVNNNTQDISSVLSGNKELLTALASQIPGLSSLASPSPEEALNALTSVIDSNNDNIASMESKIGDLSSIEASATRAIKDGQAMPNAAIDTAKGKLEDLSSQASATVDKVSNSIAPVITFCSGLPNPNASEAIDILRSSGEDISETASSSLEAIQSCASNTISQAKDAVSSASSSIEGIVSNTAANEAGQTTKLELIEKDTAKIEEENKKSFKEEFEADMAYDGNGLKHFMNKFLGVLGKACGFTTLSLRRWAVDREDVKVYGNAFLERESSQTFKTLDTDGQLYWLSDYNSRHYYGEAADITGDLAGMLNAICLCDEVLDVMHKYGICIQVEVSKSGYSKGTHFHCSTDKYNPQSKWWGIVNKKRNEAKKDPYTVILGRDYYEKETKNDVEIA